MYEQSAKKLRFLYICEIGVSWEINVHETLKHTCHLKIYITFKSLKHLKLC